jgi:ribosomal-protein-alanine N-acetyltransferase
MQLVFTPFPQLQTPRLYLREITLQDVHEVFLLRSNDHVNQFIDRPKAQSVHDAGKHISWLQQNTKQNQMIIWGIGLEEESPLIGTICLWNISWKDASAEIGFELMPEYHGKGIMFEACESVIHYGFNKIAMNLLTAFVNKDNKRSVSLLERLKFSRDTKEEEKMDSSELRNMMILSRRNNR